MDCAANVLRSETGAEQSFEPAQGRLFGRVANEEYRNAVAQIVKEIQLEHDLDDEQLAERLGCSEGTVANARNKRGNLDPVTMLNMGALYGGQVRLRPVLALVNGSAPEELTRAARLRRIRDDLSALEGD
jgi:transcriptional regulator with XRE-family HTH domain